MFFSLEGDSFFQFQFYALASALEMNRVEKDSSLVTMCNGHKLMSTRMVTAEADSGIVDMLASLFWRFTRPNKIQAQIWREYLVLLPLSVH